MTISASAFSTNVAALSITVTKPDGNTATLTIKAHSAMPPAIYGRDCPILYPQHQFQTGLNYGEADSMGSAPFFDDVTWTANYYFAHAPVGAGRYAQEHTDKITLNAYAIAEAITNALYSLGVKHVTPSAISDPAIVPGPQAAGNNKDTFHGCEIQLLVTDWKNNT